MFIHLKMKRLPALLLSAILCLTLFAACDGGGTPENVTTSTTTVSTAATTTAATAATTTATTTASTTAVTTSATSAPPTAPATDPVVHTKTLDGIQLTVTLAKAKIAVREELRFSVTVKNTTQKDISYTLSSGSRDMHLEIPTAVKAANGAAWVDLDTYGIPTTSDIREAVLKAGDSFTQTMRLLPSYVTDTRGSRLEDADIEYCPTGSYNGSAAFRWGNSVSDMQDGKLLTLDFPVVIQ